MSQNLLIWGDEGGGSFTAPLGTEGTNHTTKESPCRSMPPRQRSSNCRNGRRSPPFKFAFPGSLPSFAFAANRFVRVELSEPGGFGPLPLSGRLRARVRAYAPRDPKQTLPH